MGTVMEDKIKEAFAEWKQQDHSHEGTVMKSSTSHKLSDQLLAYIQAHPGVTGTELRRVVRDKSPETPITYVPAVLKGMFDAHFVRREERVNPDGKYGRNTFAYYALSAAEREVARERARLNPKQKPKARAKPEKAKPEKVKAEGITALVPAKRHATHALDVGPTTISIAIQTSNGTTYSMNINDAKFIYTQLNQIFGGVR